MEGGNTIIHVTKRPDGWWIVDTPPDILETGPYTTKAEAEDDLRGVEQFCRDFPEEGEKLGLPLNPTEHIIPESQKQWPERGTPAGAT